MPLPLSINLRVASYLARARLNGGPTRIPIVLMLELTHVCNLHCAGCGRIREYAGSKADRLSREQAQAVLVEAGTPVVSISGGEPLLHPDAPGITADAIGMGKLVYFCTNGLLVAGRLGEFQPGPRFFFNVHLDGPAHFHDSLVGLPGATARVLEGIRTAKAAGFGVTTNTTVYRNTRVEDVLALFRQLRALGVDGFLLAPAFDYEVGVPADTLPRAGAHAWFRSLQAGWQGDGIYHTPIYMEFLRGERDLQCTPWGTVTYSPRGWRRPCYLLADDHAASLSDLMQGTDWDAYGPGRDPRCANCLLHSGFEPSVMGSLHGPGDWWQVARWQLGR
jgi:hopanoid biosynthesis associated radical SAM protein HpnH